VEGIEITAFVDNLGDLITYDTNERLRKAHGFEIRESHDEHSGTGAFKATVSLHTLRMQAPELYQIMFWTPGDDEEGD
jgi:hypothetical protein